MASRVVVSLLIALTSSLAMLCGASSQAHAVSSSTAIQSSICHEVRTPSLSVTTPADNSTVFSNELAITIHTDWIESVSVQRGTSTLTSQTIAYEQDQVTTLTISLPEGASTLTITAQGGCPAQSLTKTLTVNYTPAEASMVPRLTNHRSPALYGTVASADDYVFVRVAGKRYQATNNGDGTWTLLGGLISPELASGSYDVTIELEHPLGSVVTSLLFSGYLTVDLVAPTATLTSLQSTSRSPELKGSVDDPNAAVSIVLNGREYAATNNRDGTWVLQAGLITPDLASGTYDVIVRTIDVAGNTKETHSTLTIAAANELGFLLAPNTGYLKIGGLHLSSWIFYAATLFALIAVASRRLITKQPPLKKVAVTRRN